MRPSVEVIAEAKKFGLIVGSGYGNFKDSQIRIANFPAVSIDQIAQLLNILKRIEK
jgi:phosphoserine aminotransferase